ncbi:MAG: AraD1 family protein [Phenylobacterium sp.]|uniref:AraD1 family protein n=1 Tax=Brevundimonas sp. TaxID=1871086 RepID=UPI002737D310|nr:AraD1 family protein [Brevundimonas sp.]MDP3802713.1 GguC family protein [Brevundimonas sp.]MDZ4373647.1 AraD1 family protein [Phenylobacterium sp.]
MPLRLIQYRLEAGDRTVAAMADVGPARRLAGVDSVYALALEALAAGTSLSALAETRATGEVVDLEAAEAERRLLPPIDHPDPAHLKMTGTGLTHLGSAEGRDRMHKAAAAGAETDSMRMFRMGLEGGRPGPGQVGAQPEWFYKGDGSTLTAAGRPLVSPAFALDGGEEPEIAGIYVIDDSGAPRRLGFALANEFSDHVTERGNYLWLAHSKLRAASVGPELRLGALPDDVRGVSRIVRDGTTLWEKPFLSGEANMSHSLANLEHHHFKYGLFRQPRDVHVHFYGTATLSFADDVRARAGDRFEIEAEPFRMTLRNTLAIAAPENMRVKDL